jgi:hypothetical protein
MGMAMATTHDEPRVACLRHVYIVEDNLLILLLLILTRGLEVDVILVHGRNANESGAIKPRGGFHGLRRLFRRSRVSLGSEFRRCAHRDTSPRQQTRAGRGAMHHSPGSFAQLNIGQAVSGFPLANPSGKTLGLGGLLRFKGAGSVALSF